LMASQNLTRIQFLLYIAEDYQGFPFTFVFLFFGERHD
jgi:hypothetical protein